MPRQVKTANRANPLPGSELRRRRVALGLTQKQLGEYFNKDGNTIARWERGEVVISTPQLVRLALTGLEVELGLWRNDQLGAYSAYALGKLAQAEQSVQEAERLMTPLRSPDK